MHCLHWSCRPCYRFTTSCGWQHCCHMQGNKLEGQVAVLPHVWLCCSRLDLRHICCRLCQGCAASNDVLLAALGGQLPSRTVMLQAIQRVAQLQTSSQSAGATGNAQEVGLSWLLQMPSLYLQPYQGIEALSVAQVGALAHLQFCLCCQL